jgi:hypothetical protein
LDAAIAAQLVAATSLPTANINPTGLLLYNPLISGIPTSSCSQSNVPTAVAQSASSAAQIAANALLNYQPSTSKTLTDPSGNPVSKVVHLRNIPSDMSELELIHFCLPFGKLYNYLMLKGKNQVNLISNL